MKVGDRVVSLVDTVWYGEGDKGTVKQVETFSSGNLVQVLWDSNRKTLKLWWAVENELEVIE